MTAPGAVLEILKQFEVVSKTHRVAGSVVLTSSRPGPPASTLILFSWVKLPAVPTLRRTSRRSVPKRSCLMVRQPWPASTAMVHPSLFRVVSGDSTAQVVRQHRYATARFGITFMAWFHFGGSGRTGRRCPPAGVPSSTTAKKTFGALALRAATRTKWRPLVTFESSRLGDQISRPSRRSMSSRPSG